MAYNRGKAIDSELFKLSGKPSWPSSSAQALQHILAMLVGNITPPILIAANMGLPESDKVLLMQAAMLIGGITTLLQLFPIWGFGMGLPNVMGVAFAYMPILLTIGANYGMATLFGAQLVGGFSSIIVGMAIGKIRRFFPPIVSGTVVLSIGLSLYGTAINYMAGGQPAAETFGTTKFWTLSLVVLAVTLACNLFGKHYIKVSGMLIGIAVGYAIALAWGGIISFDNVTQASWIALPKLFHWGIKFELFPCILMILMYIVQAVQTIGDVSSTTIGAFSRESTDGELGGAIKGQGICGMLGACIGGLPTDPYSQNVGLIVTTKVVTKRVFLIVGSAMIIFGILPKFGALMTTIPFPVIGGATITVFAAITMSGIELITEQEMNYRNKMIVGISLALGVGVSSVSSSLQYMPEIAQKVIGGSPILVSFLVAFFLNILTPEQSSSEEIG